MLSSVCLLGLVIGAIQSCEEDRIRSGEEQMLHVASKVPASTHRRNPNPRWVPVAWRTSSDGPFQAVRTEVDRYFAGAPAIDRDHRWTRKAEAAYASWIVDPQSALKLYVV